MFPPDNLIHISAGLRPPPRPAARHRPAKALWGPGGGPGGAWERQPRAGSHTAPSPACSADPLCAMKGVEGSRWKSTRWWSPERGARKWLWSLVRREEPPPALCSQSSRKLASWCLYFKMSFWVPTSENQQNHLDVLNINPCSGQSACVETAAVRCFTKKESAMLSW